MIILPATLLWGFLGVIMKNITLNSDKKVFPTILLVVGYLLFFSLLTLRLNIVALVCMFACCVLSAIIFLSLLIKKTVYSKMIYSYTLIAVALLVYFTVLGADAGFGAFISGKVGFSSAAHPLLTGEGNIFTRLLGNVLLFLPTALSLAGLFFVAKHSFNKNILKKLLSFTFSILLTGSSVMYVLTGNLRAKPDTVRLWDGHDDYLKNIDKNADASHSPNVLFIMMDDLGYGDISLNGSIYDTPNIDSIGENGLNLTNFYSAYSVCSPSRFAALTGRYPYRGFADNVIYPTVNTLSPLAATRVFNSFEMGSNVDGMLGDEITLAEVFSGAGYSTAAFGKWHLGDYGEYLPTNQGFDYFYGSHHVNDMTPFYHVREENGQWEIARSIEDMKDQSQATALIHDEITEWISSQAEANQPFFAYYASPWPHAPVFVGEDFEGVSGMGTYVDCISEFDYYLGVLFDTMDSLGILDDTIIIFTSDNGPALEGSVGDLRGGKYLAYEGGQKVPFMIRWDNSDGIIEKGTVRDSSATLVDLFPTLIDLCDITGNGGERGCLPDDRIIDGVSMTPLFDNNDIIHFEENPILHMKREDIKAIQYSVPKENVLVAHPDYSYDVLTQNEYITFKYFDRIQNDNSAFFDKFRNNWLHILNDDHGENYNRATVYPEIADEFHKRLDEIQSDFKNNRRGIIE